jgi:hypothetical protein
LKHHSKTYFASVHHHINSQYIKAARKEKEKSIRLPVRGSIYTPQIAN